MNGLAIHIRLLKELSDPPPPPPPRWLIYIARAVSIAAGIYVAEMLLRR
jgi:hypothetical protein